MSAVPNVNTALISLQDVSLQFNQRTILKQIDFDLFPQEIVTLIGPNGAGKSSFVKILLSILKPSQGQVVYHRALKFAYVPQKFNPSSSLPLKVKNLLNLETCPTAFKQQIIQETSIENLLNQQIHHLSGGERQRVLLARALLRQPDVLVLDEPMQGLDIQSEAELYDYVRALPERFNCSVIIVSHDLQWVMQGTHRVICLNKHICCSGSPAIVQQHPEYQAIFGRVFYQHQHNHCQHHDVAIPCHDEHHQPYPHLHGEQE